MKFIYLKLRMILNRSCFSALMLLALTGCGGSVVGPVQNYSENQSPEITEFKSDLVVTTDLLPGTVVTLTVETTDPENDSLKYEFSSDDGSFGSVSTEPGKATVEFIIGAGIISGQTLTVTVSVSDGHLNTVKKTLTVGTAKDGPMVSLEEDLPPFIRITGQENFSFTASETGLYQVQVLPPGYSDSSIVWDDALPQRVYYIGETVTLSVDGSTVGGSTASVQMTGSDGSNKIAVVLKNGSGDEAVTSFILREDSTPPVLDAITPSGLDGGTYNSLGSFTVEFTARDYSDDGTSGCGMVRVSYTTDGTDPDFSGNGTVITMTDAGGGLYSAASVIGSTVTGDYQVRYRFADSYSNTGSVLTGSYRIVTETDPPSDVSLTFSGVTDNTVDVNWTNPPEGDFDHITLSWSGGGESGTTDISGTPGSAGTYHVSGLKDGVTYVFTAVSYDSIGNHTAGSTGSVQMAITAPGKVGIAITAISSTSVNVTYTKPSDDDFSYMVVDVDGVQTIYTGTMSVTYSELTAETSHIIKATAYDTSNNSSGLETVAFVTPPSGSSYSSTQIHLIRNSSDLSGVSGNTSIYGDYFMVLNDINMSDVPNHTPIGTYSSSPFTGYFNGGGHTISNLKISSTSRIGLFGYVSGAVIRDINFLDCNISGTFVIGCVAGDIRNSSVAGCNVTLTGTSAITGSSTDVGGIAGYTYGTDIEHCSVVISGTGSISSSGENAGGIVGCSYTGSHISYCYFSGKVSADKSAGGIAGSSSVTSIDHLIVDNAVISGNTEVGGIVGYSYNDTLEICKFSGTVNGGEYVGGIIGYCYSLSTVSQCAFEGKITVPTATYSYGAVGGIVGYGRGLSISNCYSANSVASIVYNTPSDSLNTGGIIGDMGGAWSLSNLYVYGAILASGSNHGTIVGTYGGTISVNNVLYLGQITSYGTGWNTYFGTSRTEEELKSSTTVEILGTGLWARSDLINDGLPYLVNVKALEDSLTP